MSKSALIGLSRGRWCTLPREFGKIKKQGDKRKGDGFPQKDKELHPGDNWDRG